MSETNQEIPEADVEASLTDLLTPAQLSTLVKENARILGNLLNDEINEFFEDSPLEDSYCEAGPSRSDALSPEFGVEFEYDMSHIHFVK